MYARSTTVRGNPEKVDDLIAFVRDEVMPTLQGMSGNVGVSMMCDREAGRCIITSSWADDTAMHATEQAVVELRQRAAETMDGEYETESWEIAVMHRLREAPEGACVRVTWLQGDPALMDAAVAVYRRRIVPAIERWYGFCSVSGLVDRERGRVSVAATYESRDALQQSHAQSVALRDQIAAETRAEVAETAEFDLVLAHLAVPETV
jgi:quinol monooxygenase YgiN